MNHEEFPHEIILTDDKKPESDKTSIRPNWDLTVSIDNIPDAT